MAMSHPAADGAGARPKLRIVVVGSAIPAEAGSPQQRSSAALRRALQRFGEVFSEVVDFDGSQSADRGALQQSMALTPLLSFRSSIDLSRVLTSELDAGMDRLVDLRRLARFMQKVAARKPDLIVVEDPALAELGERFRDLGAKTVLCQGDAGAVLAMLAATAPNSHEARWPAYLAHRDRRGLALAPHVFDQIWKVGAAFQLNDGRPGKALRVPLSSMGVQDARLSLKGGPIVLAATGVPWLDKATLAALTPAFEGLERCGDEAGVVLVGFNRNVLGNAARVATVDPDWKSLNFRLGQASLLLAPAAAPGVAETIKSALLAGTPVLCPSNVSRLFGFDGATGVFDYRPDALRGLLDRVLSADSDADANAAIALAADASFGAEKTVAALSDALGTLFGRPMAAASSDETKVRRLRIRPFVSRPKLMYNAATGMLLLRVHALKKTGVSEIQLTDADGASITRILANVDKTPKPVQEIEGGVVTPPGFELSDVTVTLFDDDVELYSETIPLAEIEMLAGEIFALQVDDTTCSGAFWADAPKGDEVWQVEHAGVKGRASAQGAVRLRGLDFVATRFSMLRSRDSRPGVPLRLSRIEESRRTAESLPQRAALASHLICAPKSPSWHAAEALKDIHRGKRGWMIGNGPSVRLEDLDAVPDDDVKFCFNRFFKCYGDTRLREDYVVSADMLMIDDFGQEMVDLSAGLPLFCRHRAITEVSGKFVELTPGDTYLPLFSYDPTRFVSIGGSSVFVAMQMAYWMGIRELFLYGMDFSFSMTLGRDPRYKFPVSFDDNNHFIKGYRDAKPWCPPTWRDISAGFLNARAAFELDGGRIRNATRGGKLEIFERVAFEEAVGRPAVVKLSA